MMVLTISTIPSIAQYWGCGPEATKIPIPRLLPSHTDPDEPLLYDDDRNTPSPLSQHQVIHTAEPWHGLGRRLLVLVGDRAVISAPED
jgi:hypothetical protein